MRTRVFLYLLLLNGLSTYAQVAISGQMDLGDREFDTKIHLEKLNVHHRNDFRYAKPVAWTTLKNGRFSFDKKHLSDKDAIYRIYVTRVEKVLQDTITKGTTFILSKSDTIHFHKSKKVFSDYTSTNKADAEWRKLKAFEEELLQSKLAQEADEKRFKSYAKDSLRILMVKLIGVRQLEEKGLLEKDILKNSDFYLALLAELKESEVPIENYLFLENHLAFLTQEIVKEKYAWSKVINYILGFIVLGLIGFVVLRIRKVQKTVPLSRQEQNIQNLIVQGKTNKEIANELFISISTVKTHITNMYGKLKVSSRLELLRKVKN